MSECSDRIAAEANKLYKDYLRSGKEGNDYLYFRVFVKNDPLGLLLRLMELSLDLDDFLLAENLIKYLDQRGDEHPLLEEFVALFYLQTGRSKTAKKRILLALNKWDKDYLWAVANQIESEGEVE